MKKIIGYLPVWSFYKLGQFINVLNHTFEQSFEMFNLLNPFDDIMMYSYFITMERSMNVQEWSGLIKPWSV